VNAGPSKSFGSKNISKEVNSENSIDSDTSNSSSVSNNKKDNNNMPVEQLTSHMLSSSSRSIPNPYLAFCYLLKTIVDRKNCWLRLAFCLLLAFAFSLSTSINLS
jgi:hypothetical protein